MLCGRQHALKDINKRWGFAAQNNSSEWKILVDNVRVRMFSPSGDEPAVQEILDESYIEPMAVTVDGVSCINVIVHTTTKLTCQLTEDVEDINFQNIIVKSID